MALFSFKRFFVLLVLFRHVTCEDMAESSTLGCDDISCDVNIEFCVIMDGRPICVSIPRPTCIDQPCHSGSTCVDLGESGFVCICGAGQTGFTCDITLSTVSEQVCDSNRCMGECKCLPSSEHRNGFQCVSENGFVGENCDIATPSVVCGPSEIMISISNEFYAEYSSRMTDNYMFLSPDVHAEIAHFQQCEASMVNNETYSIKIPLPFTTCGTTASGEQIHYSENITFSNRLWSNIRSENGLYDMPIPVMDFSCVYAKEYDLVSSIQPVVENRVSIVFAGNMTFDVKLELCKMPALTSRCPAMYRVQSGAVYTIGQTIHVNIFAKLNDMASSAPRLSIPLEEMYLSCSHIEDSLIVVKLVENGCPTRPGFELEVTSGSSNYYVSSHVAFQLPRAPFCAKNIYIHAKVRICASENLMECSGYPSASYCSKSSLSKRSATPDDVAYNVIGPLIIVEPKEGRDDVAIIADERHRVWIERKRTWNETPGRFNGNVQVNVLIIGIVIFITWMIFLLVIGVKFCLSRSRESYTNTPLL